ncbi:DUF4397 domain-containing protein [Hymenobacter sp. BT635]|uniref:DUF4397 domain-containing protein n=1 Tax=Hymenobacter nitidus TaxID=2880929 RepID=A0ABS8AGY4_9BACT|nr:DUF4397 domain-containing protein [Hymenobacter nitidus]MCB2379705.1 DUF4397 domain-containing protein [Hymenobacter nitidus]
MNYSIPSFFTKLTLAATVATALVSCEEPEYPAAKPETTPTTLTGRYLVVNAAPGAGDAQLKSVDNTALTTLPAPVSYLAQSAYASITAGQRLLLFSTATNLNNNLIGARNGFNSNSSYTVFLTDLPTRASSATDQGGVRSVVLSDNLAAPASGRARVRFINLSPSYSSGADSLGLFTITSPISATPPVPPANVIALPNRYMFAPIGRSYRTTTFTIPAVLATATTPARASRTLNFANFTDIPAGAYSFQVRRSDKITNNASQVIIPTTALTFASGKIYTIYSRGTNAANSATPLGLSTVLHN